MFFNIVFFFISIFLLKVYDCFDFFHSYFSIFFHLSVMLLLLLILLIYFIVVQLHSYASFTKLSSRIKSDGKW